MNAVFPELQEQAAALMEENARLKKELESKSSVQEQVKIKAENELRSLQEAYRATLEKANTRADAILTDAEARSRRLTADAEKRAELAARCVEECIRVLRDREEQNIAFLNSRMQNFLSGLYDATKAQSTAAELLSEEKTIPSQNGRQSFAGQTFVPGTDRKAIDTVDTDSDNTMAAEENLNKMEEKISLLARSIYEMEDR